MNYHWSQIYEVTGPTPVHSDEQLERLGRWFTGTKLYEQGFSFIQFARTPRDFGYDAPIENFQIIPQAHIYYAQRKSTGA